MGVRFSLGPPTKLNMTKIYEVQKWGTTLEWTDKIKTAEEAFKDTSKGGVVLYEIVGSVKRPIKIK